MNNEITNKPPLKDNQEFSVGDKVMINKISDDFVSDFDDGVKVRDVATVVVVDGGCDTLNVCLSNPNWVQRWWFDKADISLVGCDKSQDYRPLTH